MIGDGGAHTQGPVFETTAAREVKLGSLAVARLLPVRRRRTVGPWCFLDRFGPRTFDASERGVDVPPHPHIGIQTVTWLMAGEVLHNDSLGSEAIVRPGGVNVMTAGRGIAHAEWTPPLRTPPLRTPPTHSRQLSGVQLWVALPDAHRMLSPAFDPIAEVPVIARRDGTVRIFAGEIEGIASPAPAYSEIVGAEVQVGRSGALALGVHPGHEHAVLLLEGDATLDGERLEARTLSYLGLERDSVTFESGEGARVLLIGGPPFPEPILMWWNFVARTRDEIAQARADWEGRASRFGEVQGYPGPGQRMAAPDLAHFARPNPVS